MFFINEFECVKNTKIYLIYVNYRLNGELYSVELTHDLMR